MADMLEGIFMNQEVLQNRLAYHKINTEADTQAYINQMLLACMEEVVEIMRCTAYKNPEYSKFGWKKTQENNYKEMKEELVDLMHFVVNLSLIIGMDAKEFYEIYCKKNKLNHIRQDTEY